MPSPSPTLKPREIAAELLHAYWETLYYYGVANEHEEVDPPGATNLFEIVFDLMQVPSRDRLLKMRLPNPRQPTDYWTRDDLVKEFHRMYDNPELPDDKLIDLYLDLLESFSPESDRGRNPPSMAQA